MDKKRSQRYTLVVYLFLLAISIILALIAISYFQGSPLREIMFNLSSELAGVVLIFFIVNRFFLLDRDHDLIVEVRDLKNAVLAKFSPLVFEDDSLKLFDFEGLLHDASTIDLLGYTSVNLLEKFREQLAASIRNGARLRILVVDQEAPAGTIMNRSHTTEIFRRDFQRVLKYAFQINGLSQHPGQLNIQATNWIPSCNMIIIEDKKQKGVAKIGINSPSLRLPVGKKYRDRLFLILDRKNYPDEYDYFLTQFNLLWEESRPLDPPKASP